MYYRARHYSPRLGRFVQKDPIGFAGGDYNLYGYVRNNPIGYTDPSGNGPIAAMMGYSWDLDDVELLCALGTGTLNGLDAGRASILRAGTFGLCDSINEDYNLAWLKSGLRGTWVQTGTDLAAGTGIYALYAAGGLVLIEVAPGIYAYANAELGLLAASHPYLYAGLQAGTLTVAGAGFQYLDSGGRADPVDLAMSLPFAYVMSNGPLPFRFNRAPQPQPRLTLSSGDIKLYEVEGLRPQYGGVQLTRPRLVFPSEPPAAKTTAVGELRAQGLKDAHHVIQDAAVRDIPGYNTQAARGVQLPGPSTQAGTPHNRATAVQRQAGGGTYAAERRVGYKALRRAGIGEDDARVMIQETDAYFESLGVTPSTPTRIPRNR